MRCQKCGKPLVCAACAGSVGGAARVAKGFADPRVQAKAQATRKRKAQAARDSHNKLLLTVNEAAERYKVDGMRLRALAARGSLTLHRMDGAIYLEDEQCAALVRRQCPQCLEYFTPASNRQKYCTTRCRQRAFRGASQFRVFPADTPERCRQRAFRGASQ